jgi:hypothetical protein
MGDDTVGEEGLIDTTILIPVTLFPSRSTGTTYRYLITVYSLGEADFKNRYEDFISGHNFKINLLNKFFEIFRRFLRK